MVENMKKLGRVQQIEGEQEACRKQGEKVNCELAKMGKML